MIARTEENEQGGNDLWKRLAAPVDPASIAWRQDGRPIQRDGRFIARFVAYIEANTVRERLDAVVPGEWKLTLELLPTATVVGGDGEASDTPYNFKATLEVMGVAREDVGCGKDYKQASTDAFKRVAVRFGVGHELYDYEQNWVELDGDGKYAKPVEDPGVVYARKMARSNGQAPAAQAGEQRRPPTSSPSQSNAPASANGDSAAPAKKDDLAALLPDTPGCPKCGGKMWDNRLSKRNPKAPDYKCRDRSCDGVVWPMRANGDTAATAAARREMENTESEASAPWTDEIPF